jgi:hypothetical protein
MGTGCNRAGSPSVYLNLEQNDEVVHVYISVGETTLIGNNDGSEYLNYIYVGASLH